MRIGKVMASILVGILLLAVLVSAVSAEEPSITVTVNMTVVADTATDPPTVTANNATDVTSSTAILHGNITATGGGNSHTIGFDWGFSTGNYTESWNTTGSFGLGTFQHEITDLPVETAVFWRAFAINSVGRGNSTELQFTTLGALPLAPTDFTIEAGPSSIIISWTMGIGAELTVIRGSMNGYPTSVTDGYLVYSGNGTSVTVDGFTSDTPTIYYSAWSWNEHGYSEDYAQGLIGGEMMAMLILGLFGFLGLGLMGMFFWKRIGFLAYGAAGVWALMGFQSLQTSGSANPTQITDIYMALFWLCIGFVIACSLLPTLMREKPEKDEGYVDDIGDDMTAFTPDKPEPPKSRAAVISRFGRTGVHLK